MATKPTATKSASKATTKSTATKGTTATKSKPAVKPASKPAVEKPAAKSEGGVTLKDLAQHLDREEKSLRASIRRVMGGPIAGKGGRYRWESWDDEELKQLIADLTTKTATE